LKLTKSSAAEHLRLEKEVLTKADHIIVTSPSTKTEFESKTEIPITVITNGYDLETNNLEQPKGKFSMSHIGTLLADRDPKILWNTLSAILKDNTDFSADLEIKLAGNVSESVLQSIRNSGLESHVNQLGYVSHDRAVDLMFTSQVLLLIEINDRDTRVIIPGKLFEYLASRRPIIAIGPADSDMEKILESTESGCYFTYEGYNLKARILKEYAAYKNGSLTGNPTDISSYHRNQLTQELVKLLQG
jgi:glycosyltransferase involved in cell wall biosynthesis